MLAGMNRPASFIKSCFKLITIGVVTIFVSKGKAASTGSAFYGDPPDDHHPWAVHDPNRPQPKIVTPGTNNAPPSDAIILFDGNDLSKWESDKDGGAPKWLIKDGEMVVKPNTGYLRTKDKFG